MRTAICAALLLSAVPALAADARPESPASPPPVTYAVWGFRRTDGSWVKDEKYSWTITDPVCGLEYARKINAVSGWFATDNCPEPVLSAKRYVDGGTVHDAERYKNCRFDICDTSYAPGPQTGNRRYALNWMGWTVNGSVPWYSMGSTSSEGGAPSDNLSFDTPSFVKSAYDNSNDIQNMLNTQNQINTQNMVNNIQNMVNMQNMIDTQNMINAMQANP